MKTSTAKNACLLLLAALIWGFAFVAQSTGGQAAGAFTFNCIRMLIGAAVLVPAVKVLDKIRSDSKKPSNKAEKKLLWTAGICSGIALFFASNLQQVAVTNGASTGKAGFLTACYIVLVPILGIFLKKKTSPLIWISVILALIGFYFLCITESFSLQAADILLLLCALGFAVQILIVDHFAPIVDCVRMSMIQFLVCGLISAIPMIFSEILPSGISSWAAPFTSVSVWISILYAGVLSCGVAYTIQIVGQQNFNPTAASLLMSLESVFSALAGFILLNQVLTTREIAGCALIFFAVILAQIPLPQRKG